MVKMNVDILNQSLGNVPNKKMSPKYITIHETANTSKGANAKMHNKYQHNGSGGRLVSWHYTVDDKEIWQSLKDNQQGYHAGDGKGAGNTQSIGIEICVNSDGDFNQAVKNAQTLIRNKMKEHSIKINRVVSHKYWSGKQCPRNLLKNWNQFKLETNNKNHKPIPKPTPTPKPEKEKEVRYLKKLDIDGYMGKNTIKRLQQFFGTIKDGYISKPSNVIKKLQKFLNENGR